MPHDLIPGMEPIWMVPLVSCCFTCCCRYPRALQQPSCTSQVYRHMGVHSMRRYPCAVIICWFNRSRLHLAAATESQPCMRCRHFAVASPSTVSMSLKLWTLMAGCAPADRYLQVTIPPTRTIAAYWPNHRQIPHPQCLTLLTRSSFIS